ncbi:hypothetical protein N7493_000929 [Penicillium malachiteum]|uniref:Uncharacterized protein n=1 Tax=Penicillium malachiteum TaxID=1324776 RepID=A0AAD6N1G2_9EURO|nr:hypothetical protein N7493_000929 [Penicillium malachiteum]
MTKSSIRKIGTEPIATPTMRVNIDVQPENDALIEEYIFKQLLEEGVEEKSAMTHAFFVLHDTNSVQGKTDMLEFCRNLLENRPLPKPFQGCAALFKQLDEHYLDFIASRAVIGLMNHMDSTALEDGEMGKFFHLQKSSAFPHYFRWMKGNPEPFVYFAAPKNRLYYLLSMMVIVYHRVQAEKISVVECLNRMVDEIHARIHRIEATLASHPELSKIAMNYVRGYLGFHITEPRYKISQLNVPSLKAKTRMR